MITTADIQGLAKDGADVLTTVYEFPSAKIKLSRKKDLMLITVSGAYSRALSKEIERLAARFRGDIGLEFKRASASAATPFKFDSSIGTLLRNMRTRCRRSGRTLLLCAPPPELVDTLKLLGVHEDYASVAGEKAPVHEESAPQQKRRRPRREIPQPKVHKKIFHLNQSLKRTASLEKGLDSAAECVAKFLPRSAPEVLGYDFAFFYRSSEKVGGDFFDFVFLDDQTVGISIGDVTGHGLDAALIMGISKKLINVRAQDPRLDSPCDVLTQVHRDFTGDLSPRTFVTALYGKLDLGTGLFRFARAGHEFPILFRPGTSVETLKSKGMALGLGSDKLFASQIEEKTVRLAPDSYLFLCTDGLAECRGTRGGLYTRDRLLFELGQSREETGSRQILERLMQVIDKFADGHPQEDDMTAILIRRLGPTVFYAAAESPQRER